ncbi:amino acid permease [Candidatus Micrarchaeota archaeon]|nr:amino acid permease [Candidatus Micrarchaeota archaeon]
MAGQYRMKRSLTLFDAVSVGLGVIIGAGIFVVVGTAAGVAGPGVIFSIIIAGVVSLFTALSFAELCSAIPEEGGAYEYVFKIVSPFLGFMTGWMLILGSIVAGAAVSLSLAEYLAFLFMSFPANLLAVGACLLFTLINLVGARQSKIVNDVLVILKILLLLLFVLLGIPYIRLSNFQPLLPNGLTGLIEGAAIMMFAYLGYCDVTTMSEEVECPQKTLPISILLSLGISAFLYLLVSFTAVGVINYTALSISGSPLADVMKVTGNDMAAWVVSLGAIFATATVLHMLILSVSRIIYSMSRNHQIPRFINHIHPQFHTPYVSILLTGIPMAILALFVNLKYVVSLATFLIILSHLLVNYAAIAINRRTKPSFRIPFYPIPPILGIITFAALSAYLLIDVWPAVIIVLLTGIVLYYIDKKLLERTRRERKRR